MYDCPKKRSFALVFFDEVELDNLDGEEALTHRRRRRTFRLGLD
jgi:hypothetical protein